MDRVNSAHYASANTATFSTNVQKGSMNGAQVKVIDINSQIDDAKEELPQHQTEKESAKSKAKDRKKTSTADRSLELEKMLSKMSETLGTEKTQDQSDHVMALMRQFKRQRGASSEEFLKQTKERFEKPEEQHAALLVIQNMFEDEFGKDASLSQAVKEAKEKLLESKEDSVLVCKGYSVLNDAIKNVGTKLEDRAVKQISDFYDNLISQKAVSQTHNTLMKSVGGPKKYLDAHSHFIKAVGLYLEEKGPLITKEELGEMTDSIYNARFLTNFTESAASLLQNVHNNFGEGPIPDSL